ncbi:MAG: diaminopimelate decarboxylase [Clostridia bacterium]|nr:diaminopimelate decarboxylase [Clostridia bacterium]
MNARDTLSEGKNGRLQIGGVDVKDLASLYGTPLYVFDKTHIKNVCKTFAESLDKYYGKGKIFYASKAFCCKEIYRIVKEAGLGADVVSSGEIFTALSAGADAQNLCFHGNNKSFTDLEYAIQSGVGYVVVDALSEIDDIDAICAKHNVKQRVLLRVNPGVEAHTHHYIQTAKPDSKFGFSIENGDADIAAKKLLLKSHVDFCGLHCHIGSQIFEKTSFLIAVEKMTDYYKKVSEDFGAKLSVLNLGGGFGIYYTDADPKFGCADYADYIKCVCEKLCECLAEKGLEKPYLIFEPGRSIVGEAGITLYTVGRIKRIAGLKNYLSVDGGMFENPRFALYQAKYTVLAAERLNDKPDTTYTVAGKCCESGDVIAENVNLPEMREGELVAVLSTGAYNYSMASNYNRNFVPPVVMAENGKSYLCVKGQTFNDLVRNDV